MECKGWDEGKGRRKGGKRDCLRACVWYVCVSVVRGCVCVRGGRVGGEGEGEREGGRGRRIEKEGEGEREMRLGVYDGIWQSHDFELSKGRWLSGTAFRRRKRVMAGQILLHSPPFCMSPRGSSRTAESRSELSAWFSLKNLSLLQTLRTARKCLWGSSIGRYTPEIGRNSCVSKNMLSAMLQIQARQVFCYQVGILGLRT